MGEAYAKMVNQTGRAVFVNPGVNVINNFLWKQMVGQRKLDCLHLVNVWPNLVFPSKARAYWGPDLYYKKYYRFVTDSVVS